MMIAEWFGLAQLAGTPVVKRFIKMIPNRVRRSIEQDLAVESGNSRVESGYGWLPIVLGLKIVSKTPAKLTVNGIEYLVLQDDIPLQSGHWKHPMTVSSVGYPMNPVSISGKQNVTINVVVNPTQLGFFPKSNYRFGVRGILYVDSDYGTILKPFIVGPISVDDAGWTGLQTAFSLVRQRMVGNAAS